MSVSKRHLLKTALGNTVFAGVEEPTVFGVSVLGFGFGVSVLGFGLSAGFGVSFTGAGAVVVSFAGAVVVSAMARVVSSWVVSCIKVCVVSVIFADVLSVLGRLLLQAVTKSKEAIEKQVINGSDFFMMYYVC